jgi:hypothetical protein
MLDGSPILDLKPYLQGNRMKGRMKFSAIGCGRILRWSKREIARIRSRGIQQWLLFDEKPGFPGDFRGKISRYGNILSLCLLNRVDLKRVKNNLQGFREYLYPPGVGGEGVHFAVHSPHPNRAD